jgi:DNA-directed RNA polymerase subunit alpha
MSIFINFEEPAEEVEEKAEAQAQLNEHLFRPVAELELSVRSANCLQNADWRVSRRARSSTAVSHWRRRALDEEC